MEVHCVAGQSLGKTYERALRRYDDRGTRHMVAVCLDPVRNINPVDSLEVEDWEHALNLGDYYEPFCNYEFDRESPLVDGSTGRDWIDDRIVELHNGMYASRLQNPDQIQMITDRLKEGMHGSSTNSLVAQVFQMEDLERACVARPNNSGMACVTQLQFHPIRDQLNLYQTLRSQYIDLKGYGNLVSAATLLTRVCAETGYAPGSIVEHVNNVTAYRDRHVENLAALSHGQKRVPAAGD